MTRPPFPSVIDASLIAAFRSCPRKAELDFFHHYKSSEPSVHLHAGGAYAHGLDVARTEYYANGAPLEDAQALGLQALLTFYGDFQCPEDSAKSAQRMAGALEFYFERYPLDTDAFRPIELPGGKIGVEFSFLEPLDATHPETGEPLLYSGRLDVIGKMDGMTLGCDDKTTSSLGASWPRQWDLRSQFTGYCFGALRAGLKLDGFLVRGVSILKTKYDTLQAITYRPEWQLDRWYNQLMRDIKRMKECWAEGYFDYNLDHACTEYGGCVFRQVCQMRDPTALLEQRFVRRRWDPVTRTEALLEEPQP